MGNDVRIRLSAAALLVGVAVTHVLDLPDKLAEAHYMAGLFIALTLASLVLMSVLLSGRAVRAALMASALLCALTIVGYVLSRTIGLPQIEDHVGQWADPIGIASLVCELGVIGLVLWAAGPRVELVLQQRLQAFE